MRLSEAIMLGSTQTELNPWNWNSCLIGMGFHALAGLEAPISTTESKGDPVEAYARWPWLLHTNVAAPSFSGIWGSHVAHKVISMVAINVANGDATLEQAVDWIRSVEPEEPCTENERQEYLAELCEVTT